jgi:hypothetical protein
MTLGIDYTLPRWLIDDTADVSNARIFAAHTQEPRLIGELLPEDEAELNGIELSALPFGLILTRIVWIDDPEFDADDLCRSLCEAIMQHQVLRGGNISGGNISGGHPGPGETDRRESCRLDLARFCQTYFPAAFSLPFCADHLRAIAVLQRAVLEGGLFAMAIPRGFGKRQ